jgi:ribosomal protein S18 acetylase RimI-like enzyme
VIAPDATSMSDAAASRPPFGWARAAQAGLTFRPITDDDLPFLHDVYASTRAAELALVPWSAQQKADFVAMQFRAQHTHYQQYYPHTDWLVIARAGAPAGRLYLQRGAAEHCIIDIAFLPAHCGQGLGTALLRDLLDEAAACGKAVTIHVEKFNPAMRLYQRLGFATVEDKGIYDLMRWDAESAASAPA